MELDMKRPIVIVAALIIGAAAFWYYASLQPPAGIEPMGDSDTDAAQWLTLAIGVISLLTAIVGLVQKVIELRAVGVRS